MQCEMDLEVEVKEEPVWFEGTADASLENFELVSEMIPLKQEIKLELTEPGPTQENTFEPSADIKEEIFREQRTVDQVLPHIKVENPAVSGQFSCSICERSFETKASLGKHSTTHSDVRPFRCVICDMTFKTKRDIKLHSITHTEIRPFQCSEKQKLVNMNPGFPTARALPKAGVPIRPTINYRPSPLYKLAKFIKKFDHFFHIPGVHADHKADTLLLLLAVVNSPATGV
ncbi:gastrula zinc finger protein xLCGF3.1 [Anabrus simplex]|uniref:gastrula zinc finger protein xLCGF3.1 n=1 Tax=Anabrus simplex TaxID=316456 RepID=UPI0035A28FFA